MEEVWKQIDGLGYEVSNYGRVRNMFSGKYLTLQYHNEGYSKVEIKQQGKRYRFRVHRLVANAFIPNPTNKPMVNHIDGNKSNNTVTNLEWCTHEENVKHAIDTGLRKGISSEDVIKIYLDLWVNHLKVHEVMKKYKVKRNAVESIQYKETYKHILDKVTIKTEFILS